MKTKETVFSWFEQEGKKFSVTGDEDTVISIPVPESMTDLEGVSEKTLIALVKPLWIKMAEDEAARLLSGGRSGNRKVDPVEVQSIMANWKPGMNYLRDTQVDDKAAKLANMKEKLEAKLAAINTQMEGQAANNPQ